MSKSAVVMVENRRTVVNRCDVTRQIKIVVGAVVHFSPTWESCLVFVLSTTVNFVDSQPPVLDFPNPDGAIVRLRVHTTVRGDANNVETVTQAYRRLR